MSAAGIREWNGRVAVVTGGASGIGRGIVESLLARGATVVIADVHEESLRRAASETGADSWVTDVTDASSVAALAAHVRDAHGRIDLVVNNAGVGPKATIDALSLDDWRWVIDVDLWGVIHGVHFFQDMLRGNPAGGWIVNTASMSTFFTPPGYAPYVAAKAGVDGLSRVLRAELEAAGATVGVTVLHPGAVRTNIKESLRTRPADLASGSGLFDFDIAKKLPEDTHWATPAEVGEIVVRAVENGDPYAFTHPEMIDDAERAFALVRESMTKYDS